MFDFVPTVVPKKEDIFLKGFEEELWSDTISKFTCSVKTSDLRQLIFTGN